MLKCYRALTCRFVILTFLALFSSEVNARVFNFKNETFASYFRGSTTLSRLARSPYDNASGIATELEGDKHAYNYSGEVGLLFNMGEKLTFRVGAELLQAKTSRIGGKSGGGVELFDLTSQVFVFNTTGTFEVHIHSQPTSRFSLFAGVGLSSISLDLDYKFTNAGLQEFSLNRDYKEESIAYVIGGHSGAQYEFLFADTTTMALELGFRHLPVPKLKYEKNATTIYGPAASGSRTRNQDGTNRTLDMGGFYLAASFRFYLDFL